MIFGGKCFHGIRSHAKRNRKRNVQVAWLARRPYKELNNNIGINIRLPSHTVTAAADHCQWHGI